MHMTGAEAASILAVSIIPLNVPMVLRNSNIIERFVGALFDELSLRDTPEAVVLQCLLTLWMFELRRENEDHSHATTNKQRLIAARRYIEEHISDSISLRQLADVAGLSVGHFSSEFKALFGASPIDYVLNLRLQHAAYQLQNLQMSIGQIATRTGFSDAFYFSKQFKRRYGVTPSEYRRR